MQDLQSATLVLAIVLPLSATGAPILHEYVPPPASGRWARDGHLPDQLQVSDRALPQPAASSKRKPSEIVRDSRRMDRETSVGPDRTTTHDGVLRYTAEFNPSVVPFKRMAAFDKVDEGYRLKVRDPRLLPVALLRRPTPPDRTPFWGSLVLRLRSGVPVSIPSVASEAEIISYRATPQATVKFFKDSADNFAISANRDGQLRVVFVTDAPHQYFSAEIPPLVTVAQVPPRLRPKLPSAVATAAAKVHRHLGLRRDWTIRRQLDRLVAYFRNFKASRLERDSGDTFLDIALSQRGVCRHRSWAFVITAQGLGIPARYVHNEAHAFSEVFVPRIGWIRIDLGGASNELQVSNARDKAVHNPGPDPFPRPSRFARGYSQLTGGVSGLRRSQRVRIAGRGGATELSRYRPPRQASGDPTVAGGSTSGQPVASAGGSDGTTTADGQDGPPNQPSQAPTTIITRCNLNSARRGEQVRIWGRVTDEQGKGASGLRIEIYLSRDGNLAEAMLGATVSDKQGRYDAKLTVPRHLVVGDYQLYAATPGDARYLPSLSR